MFIFADSFTTLTIFILALCLFFLGRRKFYNVFMFYIAVILLLLVGTLSFFTSGFYKNNIAVFFIAFPLIGQAFKSGLGHIKNAVYCSYNITAKYIGSLKVKRNDQNGLYNMVFVYSYDMTLYRQKTRTKYNKIWISDNFRTNRNYDIYINPQKPEMIITNRLSEFMEGFIVIMISTLMLVLPMISIFSFMTALKR